MAKLFEQATQYPVGDWKKIEAFRKKFVKFQRANKSSPDNNSSKCIIMAFRPDVTFWPDLAFGPDMAIWTKIDFQPEMVF